MATATVRASVNGSALHGVEAAHSVIAAHLRCDRGGRCLACGELEPCSQRNTAHVALFGHDRQLPRRRPLQLIGPNGDFTAADRTPFHAFGAPADREASGR
ncbi:hypothetical protein ACGFIP_04525 [Micromonospora zamorensis]|uniref:Uncharacterized protein n=3 Tax=Micromonospora TaxID=1873 RepID=A0A3N9WUT9_9ACTN|nr:MULTISPECIES: hypothetical protein [Micromonospora]RQW99271.1 hypothetical protein DLJ59_25100 [Micromonospora inaquosa]RQX04479.1 hypothetical protein DLJ58_27475 [Micromonospora arida]WSK48403.1 hypothetical protein OG423_31225 [Micromonospora zamorensis]